MAKAKLIETTDKLVVVFERSGLFDEKQLDSVKKLAETAEDPVQVARAVLKKGWVTKWQASQMLSGFYQLKVGKFHLADHLGKGELGNVYLAENPKLGRKVALKTLSKQHTSDPELVKRFLAEASAAAALDHRNIVHVHDVSSEGQRHYVVMEYVNGRDLQAQVDTDGSLSIDDATSFVRQAAEGLQYAHEQDVVHRDIKPANVMLDEQGVVKILDIGVGHLRQSDSTSSENTGEMMMSAMSYMAPEHARGDEVDARTDIYSLGSVLYFALTGREPFEAKTDDERAQIKETKSPIPLAELRSDVPDHLAKLCDRMMALKPDDRFESMAAVIEAIATPDDSTSAAVSDEIEELAELEPLDVEADDDAMAEIESPEADVKVEDKADSDSTSDKPTAGGFSIDLGDDTKPAVAAAPTDFAINTKRRKKKKKPAAKAAATPAPKEEAPAQEAAVESEPEPEPLEEAEPIAEAEADTSDTKPQPASAESKPGLSKGMIIGGICAAAVLLLMMGVGGGALMMMLLGGDDEDAVAQATPAAAANVELDIELEEIGDEETSDDEAEDADPADDPSAAGADGTGDIAAEESADSASGEATPPTETTEVATNATAEPTNAAGEVGAAPAASDAPPADASAASASTEPMPETPPAAKPADPAPKEEKPEPKPEPKPETPKKKPAPKKKAPPKPKTFVFKPAVDLPPLEADAPEITLGQVNIRPEDQVFISLDGGDIAASGKTEFTLYNARDGVAPRDWEFFLDDGNNSIVIATMSLPEKALKFKWTAEGLSNPTATNLRNCSITITAGQDQPQDLALRTAQKIPPSTIDLERPATIKLPLEGAPDRSSLKMVVSVKGHKTFVEPSEIGLAKGGSAFVYFGENREQAALALKVAASVNARGVQVKTDPYFIVPVETSPVRLNKGTLKKYESAGAQLGFMQNQIIQGEKKANDKKTPKNQQVLMKQQLSLMKQQVTMVEKTVEKVNQLKNDMAAVGASGALQFRVFSDTFDKQIDLIVPDPNAAPVAP